MSRDPLELVPELQILYLRFCEEMELAGISHILTCTRRTQEEQDELFAQGRSKPGKIVTWTHNSKHVEGKAFDIAVLMNGKVSWDGKDYEKPGEIGESIGLEWGGNWAGKRDLPHFQLKET